MTSEPFRWLEAIGNRREYIRDQLKGATPVFAISRPEGVLLVGVGAGQSKVFEVFDRHALAALGHPVDIEKLRQSAIEAAHMEAFTRAPADVTLRRLVNFSLSTALKNAFEQIASPPLIVESIFAEVGAEARDDLLARLHFDGRYAYATKGVAVAHVSPQAAPLSTSSPPDEGEAEKWIAEQIRADDSLARVAQVCLAAWRCLVDEKPLASAEVREGALTPVENRVIEIGLLDRRARGPARYRAIEPEALR